MTSSPFLLFVFDCLTVAVGLGLVAWLVGVVVNGLIKWVTHG